MKRLFVLCVCVFLLTGCAMKAENEDGFLIFPPPSRSDAAKPGLTEPEQESKKQEIRGCWLSYLELNPQKLTNKNDYLSYLNALLTPLTRLGITDLFVQVRPFSDAIYPSCLFESSECVVKRRGDKLPFDYFDAVLQTAKSLSFRVHAWINPFRILSKTDEADQINQSAAVGRLLSQNEGKSVMRIKNGLWLQPASPEARKLILDGIREILQRYEIDGVHIDDYFYPSGCGDADALWYQDYLREGGMLSLLRWRCEQINVLLRSLYRTVHAFGEDLVFSVSPGGNLALDRDDGAADVAAWCKTDEYCDWLIPQLYFGFRNEARPFEITAKQWRSVCKGGTVRLLAGLALYKVGREDPYAGKGRNEWIKNSDVIARQVLMIRKLGYDGFMLYSAQFVNFQEKVSAKACQKLKRML